MDNKADFLDRYGFAADHFSVETFCGFSKALEHSRQGIPGITDSLPVSMEINTETIACKLIPAGIDIVRYEGADAEGAFSKIGPFYLKVYR